MSLIDLWQQNAVLVTIAALIVGAVVTATAFARARRQGRESESGARLFYLVCLMCTAISANTSWRFFGGVLHIDNVVERAAMFAVLETALVACGYAMRANVRQSASADTTAAPRPQPGAPRMVAWLLAGLAGYMAVAESGLGEGIARVALGPVLGIVSLHLALGIELRQHHGDARSTAARVLAELRERVLSVLGIGDEQRDALERIRDRNARRAARLALAPTSKRRDRRLQKALRKSGVAHDPSEKQRLLAELAVLRHATALADLNQPSPWLSTPAWVGGPAPVNNGHQAIAWPPPVVDESSDTPIADADTAGSVERTPDTPADAETTVILAAVSPDSVSAHTTPSHQGPQRKTRPDTDLKADRASTSEVPASPTALSDTSRQEHDASTNGHRPTGPEAFSNDSEDRDDAVNAHSDQPIFVGDQRIQHLVDLLGDGRQLTGQEVGTMFNVSRRTGQRLINRAKEVLSAQQSRQLETVGEP